MAEEPRNLAKTGFEWNPVMHHSEIIKTLDNETHVAYTETYGAGGLAPRSYLAVEHNYKSGESYHSVGRSVEMPVTVPEQENIVRGWEYLVGYRMTPNSKNPNYTTFVYYNDQDPAFPILKLIFDRTAPIFYRKFLEALKFRAEDIAALGSA